MRIPGEAWLEFYIDEENVVHQNATFRPKGTYWKVILVFYATISFFILTVC